jgi:hypothetical protein
MDYTFDFCEINERHSRSFRQEANTGSFSTSPSNSVTAWRATGGWVPSPPLAMDAAKRVGEMSNFLSYSNSSIMRVNIDRNPFHEDGIGRPSAARVSSY